MKQKVFDLGRRLFKPKAQRIKSLAAATRAARERRDWPQAIDLGRQLLALDPGRTGQWVLLGHALKENGDPSEAEAAYREAIRLEPTRAESHLHLGHMLKRLNRPVDAADSLMKAIEFAPGTHEVVSDLLQLEGDGVIIDRERLRRSLDLTSSGKGPSEVASRAHSIEPVTPGVQMVFDISDLIGYFNHARLPTGIQRVQIEVVSALLTRPVPDTAVEIATFLPGKDHWVRLPEDLFLTLAGMALSGDDTQDPAWRAALARMWLSIMLETPLDFRDRACLINLGTSWGFGNYFLKVREAQAAHAIRYLPMVHDMVPILMPEFCVETLTQDFINWTTGVFTHADRFLANSEATKRDLITVAARLGHVVAADAVHVVRLDADFRKPGESAERPVEATLARHGLEEGTYVLFVSTIEPRKNHMAALRAWQALIARHGPQAVPRLVCVGRRGWKNGEVFETVQNDAELAAKVSWLSGVPDADLADLYRGCAFTLYPSLYEGWGLPITESLCHGKPVLASDVASLPEAGGDFADYFRLDDPDDLLAKLGALMFDPQYLQAREAHIRNDFRPRPWRDLAEDIVGQVLDWNAEPRPALSHGSPVAFDHPYSLGQLTTTQLRPDLIAGEVFRSGDGWLAPEAWGAWTRPEGGRLRIDLGDEPGPAWLMLGLRGPEEIGDGYDVMIEEKSVGQGNLGPGETRWISIPVARDLRPVGLLTIEVRSRACEVEIEDPTAPRAARVTGIGVIGFALSRSDPSAGTSSSVV